MARLFHVPLSPFCRKVRLSLAEKKIEVELVEERYWEADPDFLRRNPAAKVPVLRLDWLMMSESSADLRIHRRNPARTSLMPTIPKAGWKCGVWSAGLTTNSTTK